MIDRDATRKWNKKKIKQWGGICSYEKRQRKWYGNFLVNTMALEVFVDIIGVFLNKFTL